jgi:hypothetical protein
MLEINSSQARQLAAVLNTNWREQNILSPLSFVLCGYIEMTSVCPIIAMLFFIARFSKPLNVHLCEVDFL